MPRHPFKPLIRPLSGSAASSRPSFRLFEGNAFDGVDNLDPSLLINGVAETPAFRYKGGDADATEWPVWTYGSTATLSGSGSAPSYNQGSPLLGSNDDSVKFNGGKVYTDGANGEISTEDIVFEIIFKFDDATDYLVSTFDGGTGYALYHNAADNSVRLSIVDSSGASEVDSGNVFVQDAWYHAIVFVNRDEASANGSRWYINGVVAGAGDDLSSRQLTINAGTGVTLGGRLASAGGVSTNAAITYAAMWKRASWHQAGAPGPTEWATIAQERFLKLTGFYPLTADGTAIPTVMSRATTAMLDRVDSGIRKLYSVGGGWLRNVSRNDASTNIKGYLAEPTTENKTLQSEDLDTTWSKVDAGDTIGGSVVAPDGSTSTTAGIIGDSTDGPHGVEQAVTLTAVTWTHSVFAKKGDQDFLLLGNSTIANDLAWFNLNTGAIGTVQAGVTAHIEDWGNGIYRCGISFTGTAAAHTLQIRAAEADNDTDFVGDSSTVNIYAWGAQAETEDHMTSYTPTAATAVTRNADLLEYDATDGNVGLLGEGTGVCNILLPDHNHAASGLIAFGITDNSATNRILLFSTAADVPSIITAKSGGNAGSVTGTTDTIDGSIHSLQSTWETDRLSLKVDSIAEGTIDVSVDPPTALTEISVGADRDGSDPLGGVVSAIKLYKKVNNRG